MTDMMKAASMSADELGVQIQNNQGLIMLLEEARNKTDAHIEHNENWLRHKWNGNGYSKLLQPKRWRKAEDEFEASQAVLEKKVEEYNLPIALLLNQNDQLFKMLCAVIASKG